MFLALRLLLIELRCMTLSRKRLWGFRVRTSSAAPGWCSHGYRGYSVALITSGSSVAEYAGQGSHAPAARRQPRMRRVRSVGPSVAPRRCHTNRHASRASRPRATCACLVQAGRTQSILKGEPEGGRRAHDVAQQRRRPPNQPRRNRPSCLLRLRDVAARNVLLSARWKSTRLGDITG